MAILVLAACAWAANLLEPAPVPLAGHAIASDGDSFHHGTARIRLLGIDAPELAQSCQQANGMSWPCGKVARDRLAVLLTGKLECAQGDADRFGRVLATCTTDGQDIGAIMVTEGLAISSDDYTREESSARAAKRGLWVGKFENPRQWRDENPRGGL